MTSKNPVPPSSSSTQKRIKPENVQRAVKSLLKRRNSKSELSNPDDDFIYLILTLKKIPQNPRTNPSLIPLPHPLLDSESSNLCLCIDDRSSKSPYHLTKEAIKKKIQSENIPISKVIKLSELKSDYRDFDSKRKLCDSHDMFFSDMKAVQILPKLLGKTFVKKKKIPVGLDLRKNDNWKELIEKACGSTFFKLGKGTCSVVRVGRSTMEIDEAVENVISAIDGIVEMVPRKWKNVRSFHLKLLESIALPVYDPIVLDSKEEMDGEKEKDEKEKKKSRKFDGDEVKDGEMGMDELREKKRKKGGKEVEGYLNFGKKSLMKKKQR